MKSVIKVPYANYPGSTTVAGETRASLWAREGELAVVRLLSRGKDPKGWSIMHMITRWHLVSDITKKVAVSGMKDFNKIPFPWDKLEDPLEFKNMARKSGTVTRLKKLRKELMMRTS